MIRRITQRFLREQDGVALVMAIAATSVLAIATAGVIVAGTAGEDTAYVAASGRSAFAVAQEALAYGEGMVYADGASTPTSAQSLPTQPNGASGTYTATKNGSSWHISATGTYRGVSRTVSIDLTPQQSTTSYDYSLWNYLYEDNPNPACLTGSIVITLPILTRGNFCVGGSVGIKVLGNLEIGGNLTVSGSATVGTNSSPIARLEIAGSPSSSACNIKGSITAPGVGTCDGLHSSAYAHVVGTTLDVTPQMPTVDFSAAYNTQKALLPGTGCPANLFDNDTTLNLSNSANIGVVMFGASAYDCKVGTNEIKWTPGTGSLYVNGTFYFDGTLTIPNGTNVLYTGLASMYFTGGVLMSGGTFCGIASCTTSWDSSKNVVVMVAACWADSTGTTLITSTNPACVDINGNATAQFGVYSKTTYDVGGNAQNMAPVLCDTFTLSGSSNALIPLKAYPIGMPANATTTTLPGTAPSGWSG